MNIRIVNGPVNVRSEVILPASKSISNRALIIQHLTEGRFVINNLSDADDTLRLRDALSSESDLWHAGLGGTTARFLLALAAVNGKGKVIDGDPPLRKRPISILADALTALGAELEFLGDPGCGLYSEWPF